MLLSQDEYAMAISLNIIFLLFSKLMTLYYVKCYVITVICLFINLIRKVK